MSCTPPGTPIVRRAPLPASKRTMESLLGSAARTPVHTAPPPAAMTRACPAVAIRPGALAARRPVFASIRSTSFVSASRPTPSRPRRPRRGRRRPRRGASGPGRRCARRRARACASDRSPRPSRPCWSPTAATRRRASERPRSTRAGRRGRPRRWSSWGWSPAPGSASATTAAAAASAQTPAIVTPRRGTAAPRRRPGGRRAGIAHRRRGDGLVAAPDEGSVSAPGGGSPLGVSTGSRSRPPPPGPRHRARRSARGRGAGAAGGGERGAPEVARGQVAVRRVLGQRALDDTRRARGRRASCGRRRRR